MMKNTEKGVCNNNEHETVYDGKIQKTIEIKEYFGTIMNNPMMVELNKRY